MGFARCPKRRVGGGGGSMRQMLDANRPAPPLLSPSSPAEIGPTVFLALLRADVSPRIRENRAGSLPPPRPECDHLPRP